MSFFKKIKDKISSTFSDSSNSNVDNKSQENKEKNPVEPTYLNNIEPQNDTHTDREQAENENTEILLDEVIIDDVFDTIDENIEINSEAEFDENIIIENNAEQHFSDIHDSKQAIEINEEEVETLIEEELVVVQTESEDSKKTEEQLEIDKIQTPSDENIENLEQKTKEKKSFFQKISSVVEKTTEAVKSTLGIDKIKEGLSKTRQSFSDNLRKTLGFGRKIDNALLDEIEEILITADIGVETTEQLIDSLRTRVKKENYENAEDLYNLLKEEIEKILIESPSAQNDKIYEIDTSSKPFVILVIGVNGVGKTTTIGKLAYNYKNKGKNVIIGAADTFRAAANEQLEIWADRAEVDIVQQKQGADPAAVAFDTLKSAQAKDKDVVIIDTAGRLHNKVHLMAELDKISRVMKKLKADAPNEVYLTLDATTGQNAIFQAKEFAKVAPLTGIILTKLDGTAKGGVVIPIANELKIPVRYIGVGEKIDDLQVFDPKVFVDALFGSNESIKDE